MRDAGNHPNIGVFHIGSDRICVRELLSLLLCIASERGTLGSTTRPTWIEDEVIERQQCNAVPGSKMMSTAFDAQVMQVLAEIEEVDIETRAAPGAPAHRVTIWVVVDGDAAYVRSVRGARGCWYREATAYPEAVHTLAHGSCRSTSSPSAMRP
jgi:Uncharacterized protein conserved in bacteria (DUF2255)